jgi:hypothetical protein
MQENKLEKLLYATLECLDSIQYDNKLLSLIPDNLNVYKQCIIDSLANKMELISGLMNEYAITHDSQETPFCDFGYEPLNYEEGIHNLNAFLTIIRENILQVLKNPTFIIPAISISIRSQTFYSVLIQKESEESKNQSSI